MPLVRRLHSGPTKTPFSKRRWTTSRKPGSVFVDGERIAGSVFKAMLEDNLGIPLR
jgi:hypothetical protein